MTALNKQALREAAEKAISEEGSTWWSEEQLASDYGLALHRADAKFIAAANPATVLSLLDENYRLTAERDALRENIGGDNTRAAADIYFQLVEECEIPPGGSLVGYVDCMRDDLASAEKRIAELTEALRNSVIGYKSCLRMGHERIIDLGGDCDAPEVMIAGNPDIQQAEKLLAAGIAVKGE